MLERYSGEPQVNPQATDRSALRRAAISSMNRIPSVNLEQAMARLNALADPTQLAGQARYGINVSASLGLSAPAMRKLAKEIGRDHQLAAQLWDSGVREARIVACLIDDPALVTETQMETWALDFASWEVVDTCCCNLFDRCDLGYSKALEWSERAGEFVKRAGFVLMACLAVHNKNAPDSYFEPFLAAIEQQACDNRHFVRKAVNWALRQIGKRNLALRQRAIEVALLIADRECKGARWVACEALRELRSEQLEARMVGRPHS